jgi:hypothetical protein
LVPRETSTYPEHVHIRNTDMHLHPKRGLSRHPSLRAPDNGRHPRKCGHRGLHALPQKALYVPLKKAYHGQGRYVVPPSFNRGTRRRQSVSFTPGTLYPCGKLRTHPLNRCLRVPGDRAQSFGGKDPLPLPEIEPGCLSRLTRSLVSIRTSCPGSVKR